MTNIRIFYKISSECKIQFFRLISSQFGEIFHLTSDMIFKIGNLESVFSHQIFPMLPPFQQIFPNVTKCCHLFNFVYSQLFNNLTTSISIHWPLVTPKWRLIEFSRRYDLAQWSYPTPKRCHTTFNQSQMDSEWLNNVFRLLLLSSWKCLQILKDKFFTKCCQNVANRHQFWRYFTIWLQVPVLGLVILKVNFPTFRH